MRTLKYIKSNGDKQVFETYKINRQGEIFKNNCLLKTQHHQGYDYIVIKKRRIYIQRAIASTYDEENYKKKAFAINGKWVDNKEKYTKERNEKISKSNTGKKQSKEQIEHRISKIKKQVIQYSTKDNKKIKTFNSIIEASEETGVLATNITSCCKGKRPTAGGYIWRYM